MTLTFDAVNEQVPGPKWKARWDRSWPAYEAWFVARGGDTGPSRAACRNALARYMPELLPVYDRLVALAGGSDRAARFLSTWCPPPYLGGCSIAACADDNDVRLVRNYDLSPDLNEGLLLRSEWMGRPVMGMIEFLWGVSDGINAVGLSVALAFGGRSETGRGFGITTILRYLLETCDTVDAALKVLGRVPSHMAYNVVLADSGGATASVELWPGGGMRQREVAVATNHQIGAAPADRPAFTRTFERLEHLLRLGVPPSGLKRRFLENPLLQDRYAEGFGTLFTAEYNPKRRTLDLTLAGEDWRHDLNAFVEGQKVAHYGLRPMEEVGNANPTSPAPSPWNLAALVDWVAVGREFASEGRCDIPDYLAAAAKGTDHRSCTRSC